MKIALDDQTKHFQKLQQNRKKKARKLEKLRRLETVALHKQQWYVGLYKKTKPSTSHSAVKEKSVEPEQTKSPKKKWKLVPAKPTEELVKPRKVEPPKKKRKAPAKSTEELERMSIQELEEYVKNL